MNKHTDLERLNKSLAELVAILRLDPICTWTKGFESALFKCEHLVQNGYSKEDLRSLSSSVTYVFKGMGSFNDYEPARYDAATGKYTPIIGTESFKKVADDVFNLAKQLIATE